MTQTSGNIITGPANIDRLLSYRFRVSVDVSFAHPSQGRGTWAFRNIRNIDLDKVKQDIHIKLDHH